jgi:broad-specificity NMP kinase
MLHFKHLNAQDIDNALEEILGVAQWDSVKTLPNVATIIQTSDSVYEAAERISRLIKPEGQNSSGKSSE